MAKPLQEMSVTHIDLLRHGECEGGDIFRGHFDAQLTAAGLAQMRSACEAVGCAWHRVISSPLQRCWQFAQHLACDAEVDPRLKEMCFGEWDGKNIADIWRSDHQRISAWSQDPAASPPPSGEALHEVDARVDDFLRDCLGRYQGQHVLLVTHGGIIRVLLSRVLGMPLAHANRWEVPYGCFTRVAVYHDPTKQRPPLFQLATHNMLAAK